MTERQTSEGLYEFLRARLDEDEQLARKATAGQGDAGAAWSVTDDADSEVRSTTGVAIAVRTWPHAARHVARHDPARVLRQVEAARRIMRAHEKWCEGRCEAKHPDAGIDAAHWWSMKSLAEVYADHPDYREEWRP